MDEDDLDKIMKEMMRSCAKHDIAVIEHVEPLAKQFMDNPRGAIRRIMGTYNHALDDAYTKDDGHNYRGFIEATCGGPAEAVPWAIYNAVGAAYPYLNREDKNHALREILSILDGINYLYVQTTHTPGIREPLLLSDIAAVRPLYWPGMDEGKLLVDKYVQFTELANDVMDPDGRFNPRKVTSDFVVAYSLLRSDFCAFGEEYVRAANPSFLERVVKGVVALRFGGQPLTDEHKQLGTARLKELLPKSLHERVEKFRNQADWADRSMFK